MKEAARRDPDGPLINNVFYFSQKVLLKNILRQPGSLYVFT